MKLAKNSKGFTLVEIMIVVAIIGLLAAIAVPNFIQARQTARTNACINNLRLIEGAKEQFALESNSAAGVVPTDAQLQVYMKNNVMPTCPNGGVAYVLNAIGTLQVCPTATAVGGTHAAIL